MRKIIPILILSILLINLILAQEQTTQNPNQLEQSNSKEKMKEMDNELENYPNKLICTYHVDDLLGLKMLVDKIKEVETEKNTDKFQLTYPNKIFNNGDIN